MFTNELFYECIQEGKNYSDIPIYSQPFEWLGIVFSPLDESL
jgi:hypothetical protein